MNESVREVFTVMAALAGALVGGLIAELRTQLQGRRERRQALRRLLYQLLELRFRTARADPQAFVRFLRSYIHRRLGSEAASQLDSAEAKQLARRLVSGLAGAATASPLAASYDQAVDALAPVAPFLAYRLRDLSRLEVVDAELTAFYDRLMTMPELAADPTAPAVRDLIEPAMLEVIHTEGLVTLGKALRLVGSRLGPISWVRAVLVVRRQNAPPSDELQVFMDRVFDGLLKKE